MSAVREGSVVRAHRRRATREGVLFGVAFVLVWAVLAVALVFVSQVALRPGTSGVAVVSSSEVSCVPEGRLVLCAVPVTVTPSTQEPQVDVVLQLPGQPGWSQSFPVWKTSQGWGTSPPQLPVVWLVVVAAVLAPGVVWVGAVVWEQVVRYGDYGEGVATAVLFATALGLSALAVYFAVADNVLS